RRRTVRYLTKTAPRALTISPTTLPDGTSSVAYKAYLHAQGGAGRYQFSWVNGNLPPGLSLGTSGAITGMPQTTGTFGCRSVVPAPPRPDPGKAATSLNTGDAPPTPGPAVGVSVSPSGT